MDHNSINNAYTELGCGKVCSNSSNLQTRNQQMRRTLAIFDLIKEQDKPWICFECDKGFADDEKLRRYFIVAIDKTNFQA